MQYHCLTSGGYVGLMAFMDLGFSFEANSAGVLSKMVASNVIMVAFTIRAYETLMISSGKVRGVTLNLDPLSSFMISHVLEFEVTPSSLGLMDLKGWNAESRSTQDAVLFGQELCRLATKSLLILRMEGGSSSAVAPVIPNPMDMKVREMK